MKKIIFTLVVVASTIFNASAQTDISVSMVNPVAFSTIYNQTPFNVTVNVKNVSKSDDVFKTDTFFFVFFIDTTMITSGGNPIVIPITGSAYYAGMTRKIDLTSLNLDVTGYTGLHNFGVLCFYDKDSMYDQNNYAFSPVYFSKYGANVNSLSKYNTKIYPNPSNGVFMLSTELNGEKTVNVYNTQGQNIYSKPYTEKQELNIPAGVYSLVISNGIITETQRIIIQ
jgi:hypothetical protein